MPSDQRLSLIHISTGVLGGCRRRKKEGKSILPWKKKQPEGAGLLPDAQPAEEAAAAAEDAGGAAEPEGEAAGTAETGKEAEA